MELIESPSSSTDRMSLLTVDQVADIFQVSTRTVQRLAAAGRIDAIHLGHKLIRYTPASVEALMDPRNDNDPAGNRVEVNGEDGDHGAEIRN
jgi:excisionase family DNA binding protein